MKKSTKPSKVTKTAAQPAKKAAASAVKSAVRKVTATTLAAKIDVGFGNTLYIRGEGPGLSWDEGVPMDCVADDKWSISIGDTAKPVVFKFLLNDLTWCAGDDYVAQPGSSVVLVPKF